MYAETETFELKHSGYKFIFEGAVTIRCRDAGETQLAAEATGSRALKKKKMNPGDSFIYNTWDGTDYHITLVDRQGEGSGAVVTVSVDRVKKKEQ